MTSSSTDRANGVNSSMAIKVPCAVATTANITLNGEQTIDGVLTSGSRVLVKNQTSSADNGIYLSDTGDWERTADADGQNDLTYGTLIKVNGGTAGAGFWYCTAIGTLVPGTSALTFAQASTVLAVVSAFMQTLIDDLTAAAGRATLGINDLVPVTAAAGTNTMTGTIPATFTAYATNGIYIHTPAATNTGATTINLTPSGGAALGVKNVFSDGVACVGGELKISVPVALQYDGTQFNILGRRWFKQPTRTVLTSGTAATYTVPAGCVNLDVFVQGPGGGGAGATANNGSAGSAATTFAGGAVTLSAGLGAGGVTAGGAQGGAAVASGGDVNMSGAVGQGGNTTASAGIGTQGGQGGNSFLGGAGNGAPPGVAGGNAAGNSGSGGGGGGGGGASQSGGGGNAGAWCRKLITTLNATYTYTIGLKGAKGAAGTFAGGDGADGIIIIDEHYI